MTADGVRNRADPRRLASVSRRGHLESRTAALWRIEQTTCMAQEVTDGGPGAEGQLLLHESP